MDGWSPHLLWLPKAFFQGFFFLSWSSYHFWRNIKKDRSWTRRDDDWKFSKRVSAKEEEGERITCTSQPASLSFNRREARSGLGLHGICPTITAGKWRTGGKMQPLSQIFQKRSGAPNLSGEELGSSDGLIWEESVQVLKNFTFWNEMDNVWGSNWSSGPHILRRLVIDDLHRKQCDDLPTLDNPHHWLELWRPKSTVMINCTCQLG